MLQQSQSASTLGTFGGGGGDDDNTTLEYSFDPNAVLQRKFSIVAPPPISIATELEMGLLAQRRRRQAMERKQFMRSNLFGTAVHQGVVKRHKSNTDSAILDEVQAQLKKHKKASVSDVSSTGSVVPEVPGYYQIRDVNEPAPMNARVNHTIVNFRGGLYMYGGRNGVSSGAQYVLGMWMYLASRQQWVELEEKLQSAKTGESGKSSSSTDNAVVPSPGRRGDHSAVVVGDEMYVYGGRRQLVPLDDLWAYTFHTNTWRPILSEKISGPGPLFNHVSCYSEETQRLYIVGGVSPTPRTSCVFAWDVKYSYWRRVLLPSDVNPNDLHRLAAVCRRGKLYVYGFRSELTDEPNIQCLDEATGLWSEVSALGHPPHQIGVLWNLIPPLYLPELGTWLFACSVAAASTPTAGHVHGNALIAPSQASDAPRPSSGGTRTLRIPSSSVRAMSTASSVEGQSPRRNSTSPGRATATSSSSAEPSSSLLGTAKASVIAQMPYSQRETCVWLMAYQFHNSTWSKMTIHSSPAATGSGSGQSGQSTTAGAIFTRLLVPNTSAFERKYVAVPMGNDPAGFLICGGVSEHDRVFVRMFPKKGLPTSLVSLAPSSTTGGGSTFLTASQGNRRSTFSPAVAVNSKRASSTGSAFGTRQTSRLMSTSAFASASDLVNDTSISRVSESNLESPTSARNRRSTIGASKSLSMSRSGIPASLSRHIGGSVTEKPVVVVPYTPGSALPWDCLDHSGAPVANLTPSEVQKWYEAYYAAECKWIVSEKARLDAEEAAEARRLAKLKRRVAKEGELHGYAAITATAAVKDAERAREMMLAAERRAAAAKEANTNVSAAATNAAAKAERLRRAAYAHMGVPVLRQRDVALTRAQKGDKHLKAMLRWELIRRYVLSGEATADARAAHAKAVGSGAVPRRNPLALMDAVLWPPPQGTDGDDDVVYGTTGLSDMASHFRPNRTLREGVAKSANDKRRAFGSAEALMSARSGLRLALTDSTVALTPRPPPAKDEANSSFARPSTNRGAGVTMNLVLTGGAPVTASPTAKGLGRKAPKYRMPTMEHAMHGCHDADADSHA